MPKTAKDRALTHDEIWDDSALITSWNEALDEYKKYHSIKAKGGTLSDLPPSTKPSASDEAPTAPSPSEAPSAPPQPPMAGLLGTIRDENLKRLLMSWYYAGYYTGHFEGQQSTQGQGS